ncbi:hypothetical protein [Phaeobacter sp. C3_T13_0]|uniref:hypothetical protein n=1 Tax=Phaeobacter cretensis TaxID=3342641 RepID=UPI0039BD21CB
MRFILSFVATLIVSIAALDRLQVTNLILGDNRTQQEAKTTNVTQKDDSGWQSMTDHTLNAATVMLGMPPTSEKNVLQKLMVGRREETAQMRGFQF